ncbi:MAG TPA: hypothetical protein VGJ60_07615 [Chloroflexota bacterium]
MTLLFFDSFDTYTATNADPTALVAKWGTYDWNSIPGNNRGGVGYPLPPGGPFPPETIVGPTGWTGDGNYLRMHYQSWGAAYYLVGHPTPGATTLVIGMALRWRRTAGHPLGVFVYLGNPNSSFDMHFLSLGRPETWDFFDSRWEFGLGGPYPPNTYLRLNLGFRITRGNFLAIDVQHAADRFCEEIARTRRPVMREGIWSYLEFRISTDGTIVIRQDGEEILNESGLETNRYGFGYPWVYLGAIGGRGAVTWGLGGGDLDIWEWCYDYDDVYIADTQAGDVTDFLGVVKTTTLRPTGAGPRTQFAPMPPTTQNWQDVADVTSDDDATNVASSTFGATDQYTMEALTAHGRIIAVQFAAVTKRLGTINSTLETVIGEAAVQALGPTLTIDQPGKPIEVPSWVTYGPLNAGWALTTATLERNPFAHRGWLASDFTTDTFGYRVSN